jgi:predicted ATPase
MQNRYTLGEQIGQGGMGTVFKAYDRLTQQHIALKRVKLDGSTADLRLNLANEFRTLASLRHPHIIDVLDYGFDEGRQPFFTMPLLAKARPLTHASTSDQGGRITLLLQVLQALAYLHRFGVLHRDLKPANVLVTGQGHARLLDFGLAQMSTPDTANRSETTTGTLDYMAPELLRGQVATPASDLYSFGVLAAEVLFNHYPFGDGLTVRLGNIMAGMYTLPPDVPTAFQAVFSRLLSKDPAQRYQSSQAAIEALCKAAGRPVSQETPALRESYLQANRFVGRNAELVQLEKALEATQTGSGQVWLIGGESGVGKSRLVDELRIRALTQGVRVIRGTSSPQPYAVWREPIRRLVLTTQLDDMQLGILKTLVPDAARLAGRPIPEPPAMTEEADRQRLFVTVATLLRRQREALVLILEDLHENEDSRALLNYILPQTAEHPWLIVSTYRREETPNLPRNFPQARTMLLERFDEDAMRSLSTSMLGEAGSDPKVLDLLKKETEGNAFFMVEVVRLLAEHAGSLSEITAKNLPREIVTGGVQQVIKRRISRLPSEFMPLLHAAALLGRVPELSVLTAFSSAAQVEEFLTAAANIALLESRDDAWRFSHDKIREYLLHQTTHEPAFYRKLAAAIEGAEPDNPQLAPLRADLWKQAGDTAREAQAAWAAANALAENYQYGEAIPYSQRAAEIAPAEERLMRSVFAAQMVYRSGQFAAARDALMALLPETTGKERIKALLHLAHVYDQLGHQAEALTYARQARELVKDYPDDGDMQFAALNMMANALFINGRLQDSLTICQHMLGTPAFTQNPSDKSIILNNMGRAYSGLGNYAEALRCFEACLPAMQASGDNYNMPTIMNNVGILLWFTGGDLDKARRYLEEALTLYQQTANQHGTIYGMTNLAHFEASNGSKVQARALYLEAMQEAIEHEYMVDLLEIVGGYGYTIIEQDPVYAAALVHLVMHHNHTNPNIELATSPARTHIKERLTQEQRQSAKQQGEQMDLITEAERILATSKKRIS